MENIRLTIEKNNENIGMFLLVSYKNTFVGKIESSEFFDAEFMPDIKNLCKFSQYELIDLHKSLNKIIDIFDIIINIKK